MGCKEVNLSRHSVYVESVAENLETKSETGLEYLCII